MTYEKEGGKYAVWYHTILPHVALRSLGLSGFIRDSLYYLVLGVQSF